MILASWSAASGKCCSWIGASPRFLAKSQIPNPPAAAWIHPARALAGLRKSQRRLKSQISKRKKMSIRNPPAVAAGFASVLIGYSSSAVIVFQAARAAGATPEQIGSWMIALGIGMGLTTLGLSWRYRMPIITAWSTPGAAVLVRRA